MSGDISNASPEFRREVFDQAGARQFESGLREEIWLYRYQSPQRKWTFCVATKGKPKSHTYSLGGFRIVPEERASIPGFSPEREAIDLACGMEEKVFWSKLIRVGGPRGLQALDRVVGGKCVFLTTGDARVGQPHDIEALKFAVACLKDFESHSGVLVTTGQDLGHGILSDGVTTSLEFLHDNFHGSVLADTSLPSAEGNFYTLRGMLSAVGVPLSKARIGLIGCGHIGMHLIERLERELGAKVANQLWGLEISDQKRRALSGRLGQIFPAEKKNDFLKLPLDALVVNANGGTLDSKTVELIVANPSIRVICGCENLVMPHAADAEKFRVAGKLYCPTELCGMMGYLTAVEESLSKRAEEIFSVDSILLAAKKLEEASERAGQHALTTGQSFEAAMRACYSA